MSFGCRTIPLDSDFFWLTISRFGESGFVRNKVVIAIVFFAVIFPSQSKPIEKLSHRLLCVLTAANSLVVLSD